VWVLIPSYEPDARLPELVSRLTPWSRVVVVDDGSGEAYAELFAASGRCGAVVLTHSENEGKAAALRTGFRWLLENAPGETVVCADSDGQHLPQDVRAVGTLASERLADGEADGIVLGARRFDVRVPLRSRFGNSVTSWLVASVTGRRLADTQTGLRAYPPGLLPWLLTVRGERFAYELRMLLDAARQGVPVVEVPIETVYLDHNASSHFRPIADSWRVLLPILLFAGSSLIAFGLDTLLLLGLSALTGSLVLSIIGARLVSGTVNFALNRRTVFRSTGRIGPQIARYAALAAALLVASYLGLWALTSVGLPLLVAKVATDVTLFAASYAVQRTHVFGRVKVHGPASVELPECAKESTPTTSR
jgi:putative flippase GtrA